MDSSPCAPDQQTALEAADRVARATYLWIRHGETVGDRSVEHADRRDLVAGMIIGLCEALRLDERHVLLSAYAFFLIDGETADASCYGIAIHYRERPDGRNTRTFVGSCDFHLVLADDGWRIDEFRFNCKYVDGNLELDRD